MLAQRIHHTVFDRVTELVAQQIAYLTGVRFRQRYVAQRAAEIASKPGPENFTHAIAHGILEAFADSLEDAPAQDRVAHTLA
jgi:hypothetical protein